jgi:hypothetical protein
MTNAFVGAPNGFASLSRKKETSAFSDRELSKLGGGTELLVIDFDEEKAGASGVGVAFSSVDQGSEASIDLTVRRADILCSHNRSAVPSKVSSSS